MLREKLEKCIASRTTTGMTVKNDGKLYTNNLRNVKCRFILIRLILFSLFYRAFKCDSNVYLKLLTDCVERCHTNKVSLPNIFFPIKFGP